MVYSLPKSFLLALCLGLPPAQASCLWLLGPSSQSPHSTCHLRILSSGMLMIPFWLRAFSEMQAQKSQKSILQKGFPGGPSGKESTCQCRRCKRRVSWIQINCLIPELGRSLTVENEVATHFSILARKIAWMEEPDGHNWATERTSSWGSFSPEHPRDELPLIPSSYSYTSFQQAQCFPWDIRWRKFPPSSEIHILIAFITRKKVYQKLDNMCESMYHTHIEVSMKACLDCW